MIHGGEPQATTYVCAYCGEQNSTFVDPSQGKQQSYIEDCQICCRPNRLAINYDSSAQSYRIRARKSQ